MTEDNFASSILAGLLLIIMFGSTVGIPQDMVQRRKRNRAHGCFDWAISAIRPVAKIG